MKAFIQSPIVNFQQTCLNQEGLYNPENSPDACLAKAMWSD